MRADRSAVGRVATEVRPGGVVERVDTVDAGNRRRTAVVRLADADPIVVQVGTDPAVTRVEARLRRAIAERTSVPVPTPLGAGTVDGEGWLATPHVAGDDLHESFTRLDPPGRRRVARSFGRSLAALHDAFRFDTYGPLTLVEGELAVDTDGDGGAGAEWAAWFTAFGRAALDRLPSEFDAVRADVADALAAFDADSTPSPRLFPWDLRPGNALLSDGRVTAILDWERPLAAAPALSVAKTEYLVADWYVPGAETESLREAFRAGYESVRAYPNVRPGHRVAAVVSAAVDSRGAVTNPGYPPVSRSDAVRFHRRSLERLL